MTTTAENPTEEVDQPEVSPEPAGLEIEFCGEIYKVDPGKTFTIGRVGSLAIDDNPFLHRNFLVIESHNGLWWVTNVARASPSRWPKPRACSSRGSGRAPRSRSSSTI